MVYIGLLLGGVVASYICEGRTEQRPRGCCNNVKIDDEMKECLNNIVNEDYVMTLCEMNMELRRRLPRKPIVHDRYGPLHERALDGLVIRVKLARPVPAERNRPDVIKKRDECCNWFMTTGILNHSIFVDEWVITFGLQEVTEN